MKELKEFITEKLHISKYKEKMCKNIKEVAFTELLKSKTKFWMQPIDILEQKYWSDNDKIMKFYIRYGEESNIFMINVWNDNLSAYYNPGIVTFFVCDSKNDKIMQCYFDREDNYNQKNSKDQSCNNYKALCNFLNKYADASLNAQFAVFNKKGILKALNENTD